MKVNPINNTTYSPKTVSFKHTARPYPEYDNRDTYNKPSQYAILRFVDRLSALFTPEITQKSQEIKNDINRIYSAPVKNPDFNGNPHRQLLSVFA